MKNCKIFINRYFTERNLTRLMYVVGALWIIAQIVVIAVFWGKPQYSDSAGYLGLAVKCFENGSWYPFAGNMHDTYIFAPGFINFLILQMKLLGTVNFNAIFNLLMNIGIAAEIYYLGKKFFSTKTATIAVIFWCIMYSNLMVAAPALTELPFVFLALSAFCLCLKPSLIRLFAAGILFALANWIRPLALFFLIAVILFMFLKKYKWQCYVSIFVAIFTIVFIIGTLTEKRIGHFVYQSTTSGVNLIMTANEKAYGGVATDIFMDSTNSAWLKNAENYTFLEKDSIYKVRAIDWAKKHPAKFATLYLKKFAGLYVEDSWSDRFNVAGEGGFVSGYSVAGKVSKADFIAKMAGRVLKSSVFYFVLLAFCYSLFVYRRKCWSPKKWLSEKGILLFLIIVATLGTCVFSVSPRYHYPMMFAIVLIAAYGVEYFIKKSKTSKSGFQN